MSKIRYELTGNSPEWIYLLKELDKQSITFPNASITFTLKHEDKNKPLIAIVEFEVEQDGKIYEVLSSIARKKK